MNKLYINFRMHCLFVLIGLLAFSPLANAQIANYGFESGNFTGWSASSGTTISTGTTFNQWTVNPADSYMAAIDPNSGLYIATVESNLSLSAGALNASNSSLFGTATNFATLSQQFVLLAANQTVSIYWNFIARDYAPFNDGAIATLVGPGYQQIKLLAVTANAYGDGGAIVTGSYGSAGWHKVTFTSGSAGTYKFGFASFNTGDQILSPILVIDNAPGGNFAPGQPILVTTPVNSVGSTTAVSGGNITSDGGAPVTDRGVCWNTTGSPTTADAHTNDGAGIGSFTSNLSGLTPGTTYFLRAFATNSAGTTYGGQVTFTTVNPIPADPTSISTSANPICNGTSTQLTAIGVVGTVYWYTGSCGGTLVGTGNPINVTPGLTTTYYARNYNSGLFSNGCASTTITVNTAPAILCSSNITVNNTPGLCGANVSYSAATATGSPAPTITYSHASGSFFPSGSTTVTATATNSCGSTSCTFIVTVIDIQAPVISCPFNITVNATPGVCGAVVNYSSPAATDNCGSNTLPTSISGYAFKGNYNGHTYFLSNSMATPETAHANAIALGGHLVTINSAAENTFVSAMSPTNYMWIGYTDKDVEGTFRWITDEPVTYTNWASGEPNNSGNEDWAVINWGGSPKWNDWLYTVSAYYVVEFSGGSVPTTLLTGLGSGATFPIGMSTETWQATDQAGNVSTCSFTVTVVDNIAPTVVTQNITVQLNSSGTATITAAQVDNGSTDNCGIASIVVSKTAFNCSNIGPNTVTLTVTDVNGNVSTGTAVVTVQDITAPIVIAQDVVVQLDENGNGILTPAMVDNGSTDECGIASMALTRTDFSCTNIGENIPGVVTATMTVDNQFWIYLSTSPTDAGILLGSNGNWPEVTSYTANLIPGQTYYLHIKAEDVGGPEMFIGDFSVTGSFQFVNGQQTLTTNAANWTLSQTAFGINPETPRDLGVTNFSPIWGTTPGISSNARYIWKQNWNTLGSEIVYFTTPVLFTGVVNETILTVTDVNGNSSSQTVKVEVEDNIAPVVITQNVTIQLDASGQASVTAVQINNGSTDACGIASLSLSKTTFDCSNVGANTVTLTVTDVNGNVSTATAKVTVVDAIAPVAIAQNVTVQLDASGNGSTTAVLVDNGSNDACGIQSLVLSKTAFSCSDIATNPNVVTLTVTDNNGNVSTVTATVTVKDEVAPVIACKASTSMYVDPYQTYYTTSGAEFDATATDACGINSLTYLLSGATTGSGTSMAGIQLNLGTNTVVWTAVDVNNNNSVCTTTVIVKKRPTTLTYGGMATIQYSDPVSLSATLVDNVSGLGVIGKTITFTIGSQSTTAVTNASGVASTSLIITQAPGNYNVTCAFAEDGSYLASADSDPFTITREDARVNFTGTSIVATASSTSGVATVTLRATVQDITAVTGDPEYDSFAGDIRNARVKFTKDGTDLTGWLTPTLVNSTDLKTGVVSYNWTVDIGAASDEVYTIGIVVDAYYTRNSSADNTVVTVYKPVGDFITGGGYILPVLTAGTYAADPDLKTNFGFNVGYNKSGKNIHGNMNIIFRRTEGGIVHTYQIKANALTSLGVNISNPAAQVAVFVSKANLKDITNPLAPVSLGGNLTLQVNLTDKGEPGSSDQISISLYDGSTLLYSSNWTGTATEEIVLGGGNLVVHSGFSLGSTAPTTASVPGKKSAEITTAVSPVFESEPSLKVYPNPFIDRLFFEFSWPIDAQARLEIYNIVGAKLATVYNGPINGNEKYHFEYFPTNVRSGMLVYVLLIDGKIQTGKIEYERGK